MLNLPDSDRQSFLEATFTGAYEAPVTISNLIGAFGRIRDAFDLDIDIAVLARNSSGLIDKPLRHSAQWAVPFVFCLTPCAGVIQVGRVVTFDRGIGFFNNDMIHEMLTVVDTSTGPRIDWNGPMEDFTINAEITVMNRTAGTELDFTTATEYPVGTRLGDVAITERTLSCPGKDIAHWMWETGVATARTYGLWDIN